MALAVCLSCSLWIAHGLLWKRLERHRSLQSPDRATAGAGHRGQSQSSAGCPGAAGGGDLSPSEHGPISAKALNAPTRGGLHEQPFSLSDWVAEPAPPAPTDGGESGKPIHSA